MSEWNPNVWVPLGLTYIAAVLEEEGYDVTIIDMNAEKIGDKDFRKRIKGFDIIGITGMITEYQKILELITTVRETVPCAKIILGGPLATTLPKELLERTQADFIVIGEGEKTTPSLLNAIEREIEAYNVNGIAYKRNGHVVFTKPVVPINDLDSIPFPARHLLDMKKYIKNHFETFGYKLEGYPKIRSVNLISSRGCPYNCTFCFKGMWGYKWRGRSAKNIVDEIEFLVNNYNINGLFFNDDTFVLNKKRIFEFARLLKVRKLDIVWHCNGRIDLMQKDLLTVMHDAGCRGIAYGIESGNQSVLDRIDKRISLDQVRKVIKLTKKAGIKAAGCFMIGMLDETKETIQNTIEFARELNLDFYGFSVTTPFPGTSLYDEVVKRHLMSANKIPLREWNFGINANLTMDCTNDDLIIFKNEIFKEFTLRKQFGKHYIFNPIFLKESLKVALSLRNKEEAKRIANTVWHLIK